MGRSGDPYQWTPLLYSKKFKQLTYKCKRPTINQDPNQQRQRHLSEPGRDTSSASPGAPSTSWPDKGRVPGRGMRPWGGVGGGRCDRRQQRRRQRRCRRRGRPPPCRRPRRRLPRLPPPAPPCLQWPPGLSARRPPPALVGRPVVAAARQWGRGDSADRRRCRLVDGGGRGGGGGGGARSRHRHVGGRPKALQRGAGGGYTRLHRPPPPPPPPYAGRRGRCAGGGRQARCECATATPSARGGPVRGAPAPRRVARHAATPRQPRDARGRGGGPHGAAIAPCARAAQRRASPRGGGAGQCPRRAPRRGRMWPPIWLRVASCVLRAFALRRAHSRGYIARPRRWPSAVSDVTLNSIDLSILLSFQVHNYFPLLQQSVFLFFVIAPPALQFY